MNYTIVLGLLGGLALFLYGMQMMSSGLEAAAGSKMKLILDRPFVYGIVDLERGVPLFLGTFEAP